MMSRESGSGRRRLALEAYARVRDRGKCRRQAALELGAGTSRSFLSTMFTCAVPTLTRSNTCSTLGSLLTISATWSVDGLGLLQCASRRQSDVDPRIIVVLRREEVLRQGREQHDAEQQGGDAGADHRQPVVERENSRVVNLDKLTYAGNPPNLERIFSNPRYSFVQ